MSQIEIGCCGAYCGTCPALGDGVCAGCRLGYDTGLRDLAKARCRIKMCCINRLGVDHTCADCRDYTDCAMLQGLYAKNGYKYRKYRQATEYIRAHGYQAFLDVAGTWHGALGKYPPEGE